MNKKNGWNKMDGQYPQINKKDLFQVDSWLDSISFNDVVDLKFISSHIDELLGRDIESKDYFDIGLTIFEYVCNRLNYKNKHYKVILIIPLESIISLNISTIPKKMSDFIYSIEPPGIYIIDRNSEKIMDICEEYKFPLPNLIKRKKNIYIYLRIFRYLEGIIENWEYDQCLYLEYYSDDLLPEFQNPK
jgi:hypothetical protein